jgi:hypothetical protein
MVRGQLDEACFQQLIALDASKQERVSDVLRAKKEIEESLMIDLGHEHLMERKEVQKPMKRPPPATARGKGKGKVAKKDGDDDDGGD